MFFAIAAWRGTGLCHPCPTVKRGFSPTVARGPVPRDRKGTRFFTVARGPVPRECWITRTLARDRPSPYGLDGYMPAAIAAWRGTGPRPTVTGGYIFSVGGDRLIATRPTN